MNCDIVNGILIWRISWVVSGIFICAIRILLTQNTICSIWQSVWGRWIWIRQVARNSPASWVPVMCSCATSCSLHSSLSTLSHALFQMWCKLPCHNGSPTIHTLKYFAGHRRMGLSKYVNHIFSIFSTITRIWYFYSSLGRKPHLFFFFVQIMIQAQPCYSVALRCNIYNNWIKKFLEKMRCKLLKCKQGGRQLQSSIPQIQSKLNEMDWIYSKDSWCFLMNFGYYRYTIHHDNT